MSIRLSLSPRDRRILIVGGVAIPGLVAAARGLPAIERWQRERAAEAMAMLRERASGERAERRLPAIRDSLAARAPRLAAFDSAVVHGSTAYAAAAALASIVDDITDASAVEVSAMQLRADSVLTNGFVHVFVRVTGVSDVAGLRALVGAVDNGGRMLRIAEISITQAEPAAPESQPETLRVDVLIEALARVPERSGA